MIDLIIMDGQPRISSEAIANAIGTSHRSTSRLIRNHEKRLEDFGEVRFEITPKSQKISAYLNEDQSIFLMTLSKNTEVVVECKHQLVKAFSKLRKKQAQTDANHAKAEWQQNRAAGKLIHHDNTDTIKTLTAYADEQGSFGYSRWAYSIYARMVNKALSVKDRDTITEQQLHLIATADFIAEKAIKKGMADQLVCKAIYQQAKHEVEIFAAMVADKAER